jgi:hypothetical protein
MSKIFDSIKVYGSGTTNSSSTLDTYDSSGTTTFTIKDGGNVGIGTSSPSEKLEVIGKTKTNTIQITQGANIGYVLTVIDMSGNTSWEPVVTGGTVFQPVTFNSGVTSTEVITPKIKTNEDIKFTSAIPGKRVKFSSDEKTFINLTTGDMSVGVTSASARMHIAGTTNDSSQYAVKVEDSGGTTNFSIRNDGQVQMLYAKSSYWSSNSPMFINNNDEGNVYFGSLSAITVDVFNLRIGIGTSTPTESLDVTGNTKIGGTLNIGTIGGGSPIINLGLDSSGNVVTGTTGSMSISGTGFSIRQQLTGVNPSPSTTYYSTVVSSSSLFLSSTLNKYKIPFNSTLIGCTITSYVLGSSGSNELSEVYLRINDTTDVLLSNAVSFSGSSPLMYSVTNSGLTQSINANDEVQIKWVTPNWMSIPSSCGIFVDLHFVKN